MTDDVVTLPPITVEALVPTTAAGEAPGAAAATRPSLPPRIVKGYARRRLSVTYTLGKATFDGVNDTVSLPPGLRMRATIAKPSGVTQGWLQLRIYGLTMNHMNRMSVLGMTPLQVNQYNTVTLKAGEDDDPGAVVYSGTVTNAAIDMRGAPEAAFNVSAFGAAAAAVQSVPPTTMPGAVDAAVILEGLASQMGFRFENHGCKAMLANPYFPGSAYAQAELCAKAAGFTMFVDDGVMVILPRGGDRATGGVPLISAETGMVGYPNFNQLGVEVTTLFNPGITFGSLVEIQSILQPACGRWQVYEMNHDLACEDQGGPWFTRLCCARPGYL